MTLADTSLHQEIRAALLDRDVPAFDKRRRALALVEDALLGVGEFLRTPDGRAFLFLKTERRLYDLDQRPFQHLLTSISGLSSKEAPFQFLLDKMQATTTRTARLVEVYSLASYDPVGGRLAISDGAGGVWVRERGGRWQETHNGDGGLLFLTEPDAMPFVPEFGADGGALAWFLDLLLFARHPLTPEDQRTLFTVFLFHQFFPSLRRTRVIPACLGPQGSGKSTALRLTGRLLLGPRFDVIGLHRDKEDAFVAAITNRTVVALDNADSRVPWLDDALATYATGRRYQLRRLYSTNEEVSYEPRATLMLSSRDPQFNRPDVAERLLPLHFERPERYRDEASIFDELEARRGAIWGHLLMRLGTIADALPETAAPALPFRMADFAAFGWRVFAANASEWEALLGRLERAQAEFASDGDGLVDVLRILVERDGVLGPIEVGDLFKVGAKIAEEKRLNFPKTTNVLGRRLTNSRRVIELELGVRVQEERRHGNKRWITLTPAQGYVGYAGYDVGGKVSDAGVAR